MAAWQQCSSQQEKFPFPCIASGHKQQASRRTAGVVHGAVHRRGALIELMCSISSKDEPESLVNERTTSTQLAGNRGLRCSFSRGHASHGSTM